MIKYATIKKANYTPEKVSEYLRNPDTVMINSEEWVTWLTGFFDGQTGDFDLTFDSREQFESWIANGIDKTIVEVVYKWDLSKVYISIAHKPTVKIEFDCWQDMTEADCKTLIANLTNDELLNYMR